MNNTTKTVLSIIALLAIGFLAGYQTHRYFVKDHLKQIARARIAPGFHERMLEVLDLDETQKKELAPELKSYTKRLIAIREGEMEKRKPILDSLEATLQTNLRPDQKEKLEKLMHRMRRNKKDGRRGDRKRKKKE